VARINEREVIEARSDDMGGKVRMGISEFPYLVCFDLFWTMDTYGTCLRTWTIFLLFFLIFLDLLSHFIIWK
jgi:hypothetical protein